MNLVAHGVDLVDISRTRKLIELSEDFMTASFTVAERALDPARSPEFYAGRWAAKEAVAKALGTGFSQGITWLSIEILRDPFGAPIVTLYDAAAKRAQDLGITSWLLSISHTSDHVIASAIAGRIP